MTSGVYIRTEETKKRMSEAQKGNKSALGHKQTEEHRRNNSEAHKEIPLWNKGLTKETDERIRKLSEKMKGHEVSEETKRKMSEAKLGRKRKSFTEETKRRMSEGQIKRWTSSKIKRLEGQ